MIGSGQGLRDVAGSDPALVTTPLSLARKAWEIWALTRWLGRDSVDIDAPLLRRFFVECENDPL